MRRGTFKSQAMVLVPLWTVTGVALWYSTGYWFGMLAPVASALNCWVRNRPVTPSGLASGGRSMTTARACAVTAGILVLGAIARAGLLQMAGTCEVTLPNGAVVERIDLVPGSRWGGC